jgi:hypothetical protein
MFAILHALGMLVADLFKSRCRLEAENLFLRHQLAIALRRAPPRFRLRGGDRALLIWMTRLWPSLIGAAQRTHLALHKDAPLCRAVPQATYWPDSKRCIPAPVSTRITRFGRISSRMHPAAIKRSRCSSGIERCIGPVATSCKEANSSLVSRTLRLNRNWDRNRAMTIENESVSCGSEAH